MLDSFELTRSRIIPRIGAPLTRISDKAACAKVFWLAAMVDGIAKASELRRDIEQRLTRAETILLQTWWSEERLLAVTKEYQCQSSASPNKDVSGMTLGHESDQMIL